MGNSSSAPGMPPSPMAAPSYPVLPSPSSASVTVSSDDTADEAYKYWDTADVKIDAVAPNGMPAWPTDQRLLRYFSKATMTRRPVYMNMKKAYDSAILDLKALAADQDAWWLEKNTVHMANLNALGAIRDQQMDAADADGQRMADELIEAANDYKAQLDAYAERIAANRVAEVETNAAHREAVNTTDFELCHRMREIKSTVEGSNTKISGLLGRGFLKNSGLDPPSTHAPDSCEVA